VLWGNSDVEHKEDAETLLCIGFCMKTKAEVMDGNKHDENDPGMGKVIQDMVGPPRPTASDLRDRIVGPK
jgi:hypothetical protein